MFGLKRNVRTSVDTQKLLIGRSPFSSPLLFSCIPGGRRLTQHPPRVGRPMATLTLLQYGFGDGGGAPPSLSSGAAQRFLRLQKLKIKVEEEHKQRSLIGPLNRRSPASLPRESKWRSRQGAHNTTYSDFAAEKRLRPLAAGGRAVLVAVGGGAWVKGQHFNMGRWVGFSKCQLTSAKTTITQVRL